MYKSFYMQASEMADMIRSGEYKSMRDKMKGSSSESTSRGLVSRPQPASVDISPDEEDMMFQMAEMIADLRTIQEETAPPLESTIRPRSYEEGGEDSTIFQQAEDLLGNEAFVENLQYFKDKHGVSEVELFNIIKGESNFNPKAQNKGTKAAGLFQFIPTTASELGFTVDEIIDMEPAEQLMVYDQYLDRWGYKGEGLGIMQAAPAFRSAADGDTIYDVGTAAWEANPGWRSGGTGPITKASINNYYQRTRK